MAPTRLAEAALAALAGRRVVLIGDLMLDAYLYGETLRVSREAPVVIVKKERLEERLGGAANTAANLAALALEVSVLGAVGDDPPGERLIANLAGLGVDTSGVLQTAAATATKTRVLAGAPGTSRQQVLRIDEEPDTPLATGSAELLAKSLRARAADADVVVVSDYGVGALSGETIAACRALAGAGSTVVVDSRHRLSEFGGVTAVTPNLPEAERLVGYALVDAAARARAGDELLSRLGCEVCLLTEGRGGMTLFLPGAAPDHIEIVGPDEVTDVTGAGDTVIATFAAALAAGLGPANAMRLANCAAGVVVGRLGTATASRGEIAAALWEADVELSPWQG